MAAGFAQQLGDDSEVHWEKLQELLKDSGMPTGDEDPIIQEITSLLGTATRIVSEAQVKAADVIGKLLFWKLKSKITKQQLMNKSEL